MGKGANIPGISRFFIGSGFKQLVKSKKSYHFQYTTVMNTALPGLLQRHRVKMHGATPKALPKAPSKPMRESHAPPVFILDHFRQIMFPSNLCLRDCQSVVDVDVDG